MKILVIDDDESIIRLLTGLLRFEHEVDGATSAASAVELIRANDYDVVFVDYAMPEHDGIWFMKNAHLPRQTTALLITGFLSKQLVSEMFNLGISGYVTKPLNFDQIRHQLDFVSKSGKYANYCVTA